MAASRVTFKWNPQAFKDIRTAPKVMEKLNELAQGVADRAGDGFEAKPATVTGGRVRGRAAVIATTAEAMRGEAKDHRLLKAIGNE